MHALAKLYPADFERRLAQTTAWCSPRARIEDPIGSLRHPDFRPRVLEPSYQSAVDHVDRERNRAFGWKVPEPAQPPTAGRFLLYFPDAELSDGAAEAESNGFFDVCNTPPWDTWLCLVVDSSVPDPSYRSIVVLLGPGRIRFPGGRRHWRQSGGLHPLA